MEIRQERGWTPALAGEFSAPSAQQCQWSDQAQQGCGRFWNGRDLHRIQEGIRAAIDTRPEADSRGAGGPCGIHHEELTVGVTVSGGIGSPGICTQCGESHVRAGRRGTTVREDKFRGVLLPDDQAVDVDGGRTGIHRRSAVKQSDRRIGGIKQSIIVVGPAEPRDTVVDCETRH